MMTRWYTHTGHDDRGVGRSASSATMNRMNVGGLEAVQEEDPGTVEEARKALNHLRDRHNTQSRLLLKCRARLKQQDHELKKLRRENVENLNKLQSQLLLFESKLRKGQKEIHHMIVDKDRTLRRQHQLILALATALTRRGGQQDLQELIPNLKLDLKTDHTKDRGDNTSDSHMLDKEKTPSLVITSLKSDLESLNDSDSAIMLEDNFDSLVYIPLGKGEVKVVRSVSDAVECATRGTSTCFNAYHRLSSASNSSIGDVKSSNGDASSISTSPSCSSEEGDDSPTSTLSKFKGKHEIMRTVYSPDETIISHTPKHIHKVSNKLSSTSFSTPSSSRKYSNLGTPSSSRKYSNISSPCSSRKHSTGMKQSLGNYDSDATISDGESDNETVTSFEESGTTDRRLLVGSYEKLNNLAVSMGRASKRPDEEIQVTYNRVMSNHRSVTKPKDVKYKRINKAKSRSLEELRGKLRHTDGKHTQASEGYQTQSFA